MAAMSPMNMYTSIAEAASVAPIVLSSNRYEGNLYLATKNTFLEFYTDESKAIKRSAKARSLSADSRFNLSDASTQANGTPTNRSLSPSSPSIRSMCSEDEAMEAMVSALCATPSNNQAGYPMTMMPQMRPMGFFYTNECQTEMQQEVVKSFTKKGETANQKKAAKKKDLKTLNEVAAPQNGITTLMLRGIPCRFSQESLAALIDESGFKDKFNFFYLPRDGKRSANLGYAFINFIDEQSAESFVASFQGVPLAPERSQKVCTISPADIQGLSNLRRHFCCTAVSRGSNGPMFIKAAEKRGNRKHAAPRVARQ